MSVHIDQLRANRLSHLPILETEDVVAAAKEILGHYLVTEFNGQLTAGLIVETEAYRAPEDKASHAYNHRKTARTAIFYEGAGRTYVYLCYGIHQLFNIISGPVGIPHAILIRAIEPISGIDHMLLRREHKTCRPQLTAGPGVLSKALGINKSHSGLDLFAKHSPIWLSAIDLPPIEITASPRVGIDYAAEWKDKPWRFRIKGNPYCSKAK